MTLLPYVSDELLHEYTKDVLDKVLSAYVDSEEKIHSNVVDPFSALFDAMRQGISFEDWLMQERSRQVQKTLQNAVGDFHQNILGSVKGWQNPGRGGGYDIINREKRILGEIKNKWNTLNSSSAESTYKKLARYIDNDFFGYTGYVVFIVPKQTEDYDVPWSPNQVIMPRRSDIRRIDGESFYKMVTGLDDALEMLFDVLPSVIEKELHAEPLSADERAVLKELFIRTYK
jgi:hypothetical protein